MSTTWPSKNEMATILKLDDPTKKSKVIARVVAQLKANAIVCLPTDTCYGLSCLATSKEATQRLMRIKSRGAKKLFILIVSDAATAKSYADNWSAETASVTDTFWPGPISVVVPFRQPESRPIIHTEKTIAIRLPALDILREIITATNCPLWSTSADEPGSTPPATTKCVQNHIIDAIDLIIDIGELRSPHPSTIIDLSTQVPTILREGTIKSVDIISKTNIELLYKIIKS